MSKNWQVKKLGEVIKLEYGKPLPPDLRNPSGAYPVYGANGIKDRTDQYYIDRPSIVIGRKGSAGEINLTESKFWPLDVTYFLVFDEKEYQRKFLFYLLSTLDLPKLAKGVKPGINRNEVYDIDIPLPPLPEQHRIVAILDEAFAAIDKASENTEKNLENAREVFESYLNGVFDNPGEEWVEKRLCEVGTVQTGTTPSTMHKEYYGSFIPFIKPADIDIDGMGGNQYNNDSLSELGLKKGRGIIQKSILMVCIGASIGKVGYTDRNISCNQQINTLTVDPGYEPKFFYYAMRTLRFQQEVITNASQATLPILKKSKWAGLSVVFPKNKVVQKQIVFMLDQLVNETKKLENIYQRKLDKLQDLKKSLLQKAFTGELNTGQS